MTDTTLSAPAGLAAARERFAPVLERLAVDASRREREHELPTEAVRELAAAGLGALRLPVESGGCARRSGP